MRKEIAVGINVAETFCVVDGCRAKGFGKAPVTLARIH